jgi:hypothetical protein
VRQRHQPLLLFVIFSGHADVFVQSSTGFLSLSMYNVSCRLEQIEAELSKAEENGVGPATIDMQQKQIFDTRAAFKRLINELEEVSREIGGGHVSVHIWQVLFRCSLFMLPWGWRCRS